MLCSWSRILDLPKLQPQGFSLMKGHMQTKTSDGADKLEDCIQSVFMNDSDVTIKAFL